MSSEHIDAEILSQPETWRQAAALAVTSSVALPSAGERVAVVGCGTSWFMAMSYAVLRETRGLGETDAFAGSEFPAGRSYDRVVVISRSGTTSEISDLLAALSGRGTTLITAVADSPAAEVADQVIALPFADERSVVQTRFATSALTLLRAGLGDLDIEALVRDGQAALDVPVADLLDADQCTFLGAGWTVGLAHEAALKTREAAQYWSEVYPAMEYRHGPISIAQPGRLVWHLGEEPEGIVGDVAATGARWVQHALDPIAGLVVAQRFAAELSKSRGLDTDNPRSLTRSVILT